VSGSTDTLRAAIALGEELVGLLSADDTDGDAIGDRLVRRRALLVTLAPRTPTTAEERELARIAVALDERILHLCDERCRVVAAALTRVRQRAPQSAPGRVLTDVA